MLGSDSYIFEIEANVSVKAPLVLHIVDTMPKPGEDLLIFVLSR
jgi:hypothetical protein